MKLPIMAEPQKRVASQKEEVSGVRGRSIGAREIRRAAVERNIGSKERQRGSEER